jgi:hypothetical protein
VPLADFAPRRRLNLSLCITAKWPADARGGSIALDRQDRDARPMSASPPIAVKHWHCSETPLRANRDILRRNRLHFIRSIHDVACLGVGFLGAQPAAFRGEASDAEATP